MKIVDKGLDAAKGITKLVKAGEKAGEAAKVYGPTARRVKLRQSVKEQLLERQPRNIEGQIIDPNKILLTVEKLMKEALTNSCKVLSYDKLILVI